MITIARSIMKKYDNFFRCTVFPITHSVSSNSIFTCIVKMISNFTIFFIFNIFIFKLFCTNIAKFAFSYDSCCSFANNLTFFVFKINSLHCSPTDSQFSCMQSLLLHTCFFSVSLNDDIVDLEKPDEMLAYFRHR